VVSYLKFQLSSPSISIALLVTLCRFYFFLEDPNLIGGHLDQVGSSDEGLVDVLPTERGLALPSIQCFIRGHPYTGMVTIVVEEFNERQLLIPSPLEIQSARSQHIFQHLDCSFHLFVHCWMERRAKTE